MKRAVAYVSDIILGRTGEVIKRSGQAELIVQYAADNGIEIVRWFEDEMYNEDVLARPGIQALLSFNQPYDIVLCERVWALSRSMAVLEPFFRELDRRGAAFESATTMWDCVSQRCRHRSRPGAPRARPERPVRAYGEPARRIARPARMHFAHVIKHS